MYTNAQNQQILRILLKALDLNSFVTNQYLISRLVYQGQFLTLPIAVLTAFPDFITMQVTEEDIAESAQSYQGFYTIDNYIYIPYRIIPNGLVMKDLVTYGTPKEILSYIKTLHGNNPLSVNIMSNHILLFFPKIDDCLIFWRGTKYYPFKGDKFIKSEIYSQAFDNYPFSPLQEEIVQIPDNQQHQAKLNEQPHQPQEPQKQNSQYNEKFQYTPQNYYQKKSQRQHDYRYSPKSSKYGDNGSQKFSQSQKSNKNKDRYYSQNQQHKPPTQILLQNDPKPQPNPPQFRYPQIQIRSHSQPLVLQQNQQKSSAQFKFQQQAQPTQSPQAPALNNRSHRQNQQQQQQHQIHHQQEHQQQNQSQTPLPQPQIHAADRQQQQPQDQQQSNTPKSSNKKKYYRFPKRQNQKK